MARVLDRGWGEMAFEYRWASTSGIVDVESLTCPDLDACTLYEYTTYQDNAGRYAGGWYYPPDPPFDGWKFRDPTDGRTAPVALGCFSATQGRAWDRHKTAGRLLIPALTNAAGCVITGLQEYRFHCDACGVDARVSGSHAGPHSIVRRFGPRLPAPHTNRDADAPAAYRAALPDATPPHPVLVPAQAVWRYALTKHGRTAWLDITPGGYQDDSAHIGFGP